MVPIEVPVKNLVNGRIRISKIIKGTDLQALMIKSKKEKNVLNFFMIFLLLP